MIFLGNWFPTLDPETQLGPITDPETEVGGSIITLTKDEIARFQWLAEELTITIGGSFHFGGTLSGDDLTEIDVSLSPVLADTINRTGGFTETDDIVAAIAATTEGRPYIETSGTIAVAGTHRFYDDPADPATMVTDYEFTWGLRFGTFGGTSAPGTYQWYQSGFETHGLWLQADINFRYRFDSTGSFTGPVSPISTRAYYSGSNTLRGTFDLGTYDGLNPIIQSVGMYYPFTDSGLTDMVLSSGSFSLYITNNLPIST